MHIELAPVDEKYIKESVKNGYYRSEAEAVRDAVRRAREQDEAKRARLFEALRQGQADIAAGQTTPYTPTLLDKITQEARQHAAEGSKPSSDVIP